ncbi:MAG: hypothetical protein QOC98_304 [Frankiaceae bacterium]|nr:hypothetical protein [Frankiaceae bacterium]
MEAAPSAPAGRDRRSTVERRSILRLAAATSFAQVASGCQTRPVTHASGRDRARRIAYGDHRAQFVELTLPSSGSPKGVVVVVHGGFWKAAYDIDYGRPLAASLAEHGWAAWNIE